VTIRRCRQEDLPGLEWFGMFTAHRELIGTAYERQRLGEVVMLVASVNGFPAGQVWVDLVRPGPPSTGRVWALRVLPVMRGLGLGTRLLAAAEKVVRVRRLIAAEIGVEKHNPRARLLYERLGYIVTREELEEYEYSTPDGVRKRVPVDQWILRKALRAGRRRMAGSGEAGA
jgi:ribosomal protein S18 acetylase RimI-like enzyme